MKNKGVIQTLMGFTIAAIAAGSAAAPDPNFHIYLMVGQSNMEGAAPIESQDQTSHPRVQVMQDANCGGTPYGEWREATPPLIRCGGSGIGLGPGDNFGKVMADNAPENVTIGLVGAAYGGAPIEYFLPQCGADCPTPFADTPGAPNNGNDGGYVWLIDLAKKAQQDGVIKGIIFHQGESNGNKNPGGWTQNVKVLVDSIRSDLDLGVEETPFIAGELPYDACCAGFNSNVNQIPGVVDNSYVVSAGPENGASLAVYTEPNGQVYHWDSSAVRIMGKRYADEMMKHISYGPVDCGTSSEGNPVCCNVSADPDGDGWGTQNDGEMCEITPDTAGYVPPLPEGVVAAINVGSSTAVEYNGIYFRADRDFSDGELNSTSDSVAGSDGSALFQSERYGDFSYDIDLPNGDYTVTLYFAELYQTAAGNRIFNVDIEDQASETSLDLFQEVGAKAAYVSGPNSVSVSDNSLSINITSVEDNGTLSGILVEKAESAEVSSSSSSVVASSSSSQSSTEPFSSTTTSSSSSETSASTGGAINPFFVFGLLCLGVLFRSRKH